MSTRALHERMKMIEVPIPYSERIGRSKLNIVRDGMRFGQSIVWTALNYNPARPFGIIGMILVGIAALMALLLVVARLQGIQSLSSVEAFAIFSAVVFAVAGVTLLALGFSFNYFVALFHKTPVRQGLWGKPLFNVRWEQQFGWMGLVSLAIGRAACLSQPGARLQRLVVDQALALLPGQCFAGAGRHPAHGGMGPDAGIGSIAHSGSTCRQRPAWQRNKSSYPGGAPGGGW